MTVKETIEQKAARFARMTGNPARKKISLPEDSKKVSAPKREPVNAKQYEPAPVTEIKLMQDMSPEELAATEVDKVRWFEAWKMYQSKNKQKIVSWLEGCKDPEVREDLRRRLNVIRTNKSRIDKTKR